MPFVKHAMNGLGGFLGLLVGVAIDVDENIFAPVGGSLTRESVAIGLAFEVAVEPIDLFVTAIGIGNGIDEDDEIFADAANHGLFGGGEGDRRVRRRIQWSRFRRSGRAALK